MKKKILSIVICMLMCVTVSAVTGAIKQNPAEDLISTGLAKNATPISNIESAISGPARSLPFYAVNDATDYFCSFDPSSPGTFTNIGLATPAGFIQNACFVEDVYWVVDQYGNLYTVNLATGVFTTVGPSGITNTMGLAYDDTTSTLFMTAGSTTPGNLYEINMGTGSATLIGTLGNTGFAMISMVCDNDGQLYGVEITSGATPGQFYSIDKTTGAATTIGTGVGFIMNYGQDMEYDKDNDILYFCAYNQGTASPEFRTIDKTTGLSTFIGNLPGQTTGFGIPYSITANNPPVTPAAPAGPTSGSVGASYSFTASTTDPEGDNISYMFDWGDGNNSGWLGPFASGATATGSHAWTEAGSYDITVKAKDAIGAESGVSAAHTIVISAAPTIEVGAITGGLFKVKAVIKNNGAVAATNVTWNIDLAGGIILLGKASTGKIPTIAAGGTATISSKMIVGFGKTVITVTADTASKTQNATVLLIFIKTA